MRLPLKALFSWAGRQPLVMHNCICYAVPDKDMKKNKKLEHEFSIVK